MRPPDLVVDLDLAVRRDRSVDRLRARHVLRDRTVTVATAGAIVPARAVDVREWRSELTRTCRVTAPDGAPTPPSGTALPWDLVVGTGAALAAHRHDLYDELLARADGSTREQLGRLHQATVGRLRAVGTMPGRRVGWISWVLFADGWRALTPSVAAGPAGPRALVRLERRLPDELAHDVARWVTGVAR